MEVQIFKAKETDAGEDKWLKGYELVQLLYVNGHMMAILVDKYTGSFISKQMTEIRKVIQPEVNPVNEGEKHGSIRVDAASRGTDNNGSDGRTDKAVSNSKRRVR